MVGTEVLRKVVRSSRKETAEEAGMGSFRLWQIESGCLTPTYDEQLRLYRALGRILKKRSAKFHALLQETTTQPPSQANPGEE